MDSAHIVSVEHLEPRLLLDGGWALTEFARWYGGGDEAYGPDSDIVVRVTSEETYINVGMQATPGFLWSSNDFMVKGQGWSTRILTDNDNDGTAPSLVQTPTGQLRAIWYNTTDQSLMFAAQGDSSWWDHCPITIDSGNAGEWSDMVLADNGDLHIVYYHRGDGAVKYAYHADGDSWYSWTIETIDTVGDISATYDGLPVAEVAAIAVDSSGIPHVAYYSAEGTQLEYAYRTGADAWVNTVLDSDDDVGTHPSIAVDRADNVHLVYYHVTNHALMYNVKTAAGWGIAEVVEGSTAAGKPQGGNSLALDALGNPHIAYTYTLNTNAKNLKHGWIETGAWTNETVTSSTNHGFYPSMTITQAGDGYISYGQRYAGSVWVAQKAEIGEPGGPDLAVTIDSAGGGLYVPGDIITSEVTITNVGLDPAVGEVRVQIGVAIDTGSGFIYDFSYDRHIMVNLTPGEATQIRVNQPVPSNAFPGEVYQVAIITPDSEVGDGIPGNNTFQAAMADEIIWAVGDVDGRTVRSLVIEDIDGDMITLSLSGAGTMVATRGDDGIDEIIVSGTDNRSSIKISVRGADGQTFVGNLIVEGDVLRIDAPNVYITGDVTISGFCRTLILGTVDVEHTITINGDQVAVDPADLRRNAVTLVFADVAATTVDTNGLAIQSIRAVEWNGGSITAPWIGSIQITGSRDGLFDGDLNVDLVLSGVGSPRQTLGTVRAANDISGGAWDIVGNVGVIQANGTNGWSLLVEGDLGTLRLRGSAAATEVNAGGVIGLAIAAEWQEGGIAASEIRRITLSGSRVLGLAGDAEMSITVSGDGVAPGRPAVGAISAAGVVALNLNVTGAVGTIQAAGLTAATSVSVSEWVRSVAVRGDLGGSYSALWIGTMRAGGELSAAINATGADARDRSIISLTVGAVGAVDLSAAGGVNALRAVEWTGGSIDAAWMGTLQITGDRRAGVPGDFGAGLNLTDATAQRTLGNAIIAGQITGDTWQIAGSIGLIRANGGMAGAWVLNAASDVRMIDAGAGDMGGAISIDYAGTIRTRGGLLAGITANGADTRDRSIVSLQAGSVGAVDLSAAGGISVLRAVEWTGGSIEAAWMGTIQITGDRRADIAGDFGASVDLTSRDARGVSLNSLVIAGTALNSSIRTAGSMGGVAVGATIGSDFLAGVDADVIRQPVVAADFVNPDASIRSFTVRGLRGIDEAFFVDSNIAAASIGAVSLLNGDFDTGDSGIFAAAASTMPIWSVRHRSTLDPSMNWVWPASDPDDIIHVL